MRNAILTAVVMCLFGAFARAAEPELAPPPHEPAPKVTRYTVQVTSTDKGAIANINLRGAGLPEKGIDFKADVSEYTKKLKELAAKHDDKRKPAAIDMEIDGKLVQAHVVQLIDTSISAGFADVSPTLLDPKKR
jgi:hypothetical protein